MAADYALLLSIVSSGPKTAAVLLAELGDVRRFANVRDLVAYVGLCPRLCPSGSSVHGPTPLAKGGHAGVRKLLHLVYGVLLSGKPFDPAHVSVRPVSTHESGNE